MEASIEISKSMIARLVKKYFVISILIGVFAAGVGAFGFSKFQPKSYFSSGELVQNDNNYNLIASYTQFTNSKKFKQIMNAQIKKSKWKNQLENGHYTASLETNSSSNSPFFTIEASSDNPEFSNFLVDTEMDMLVEHVGNYLSAANISVVSRATKQKNTSQKDEIIKISEIIFVIVFLAIFIFGCVYEAFFGKTKDEAYNADFLHLQNLGTITIPSSKEK